MLKVWMYEVRLILRVACLFFWWTTIASGDQRVVPDLPYVPGGEHKQQLDLYIPEGSGFATILIVHGGSLTDGDRKDAPLSDICRTFNKLGIACAATSYRLGPANLWPAQPQDVASAFAWLKQHITEYGGDSTEIFMLGHSSGGLLVALVSTDSMYLEDHDLKLSDIAGVFPMGSRLYDQVRVSDTPLGNYEDTWVPAARIADFLDGDDYERTFGTLKLRQDAVPALHVSAQMPPTLVLVAEGERFFPPVLRDAAEFVGRALECGAQSDLAILADRKHMSALELMVAADDPTVQLIARTLEKWIAARAEANQ